MPSSRAATLTPSPNRSSPSATTAQVDADAEEYALVGRHLGIPMRYAALDGDCAAHRVDHARELDQDAVAAGLDDAPLMVKDCRIDQLCPQYPQPTARALLVAARQPRIAGHVGGENGGQSALCPLLVHKIPRYGTLPWRAKTGPVVALAPSGRFEHQYPILGTVAIGARRSEVPAPRNWRTASPGSLDGCWRSGRTSARRAGPFILLVSTVRQHRRRARRRHRPLPRGGAGGAHQGRRRGESAKMSRQNPARRCRDSGNPERAKCAGS